MINDTIISSYLEKYQHNADCILLVGSRAEGFSTRNSDIDLIVITQSPESYGVESNHYLLGTYVGIKFEILITTRDDLNISIEQAFMKDDFYTLQKILYGKMIYGSLNLNIDSQQSKFRTRYYIKNTDQALKMYYSLKGIKSDCHIQQYAFSLKNYLEKIAEIYLFQQGDNYIKPRWLISRLIRKEGEHGPLLKSFFDAINYSISSRKDVDNLECQVMNVTALMLYNAIYNYQKTNEDKKIYNLRFFAMERESKIVLFCDKEVFLLQKEKAKEIIEKMMFEGTRIN
ncbi:nucleotidyltransferase domain-containing protein [Pantoea agglomerans]|uniref:nucleotidyltransferase domain-containing protein n=1 Tax=Enterobacter agglomerans TaxID=549 RepID=UPI002899B3E0|nr:nucleotidyltransferase domain-containing protein [Pantoea agglomerans]WNK47366.1 nucleotidyltransferase domain-containing protein [Pantoea agglomerans]